MFPRLIVADLQRIARVFALPALWLAFGIVLVGTEIGRYLGAFLFGIVQQGFATETGTTIVIVSSVRLAWEIGFQFIALLMVARSDETHVPALLGSAAGFLLIENGVLLAVVFGAGALFLTVMDAGNAALFQTYSVALAVPLHVGLAAVVCLAVARARGDADFSLGALAELDGVRLAALACAMLVLFAGYAAASHAVVGLLVPEAMQASSGAIGASFFTRANLVLLGMLRLAAALAIYRKLAQVPDNSADRFL